MIIDFDLLIYYNENGNYIKKDNGNRVMIERGKSSVNYYAVGHGIETVNPTMIDDKLIFYLYKTDVNQNNDFTLSLIEFEANTY